MFRPVFARDAVEPFLCAWELNSTLKSATDKFEFAFQSSDVIDRNPTPGVLHAEAMAFGISTAIGVEHVAWAKYPDPPVGLVRDSNGWTSWLIAIACFVRAAAGLEILPISLFNRP